MENQESVISPKPMKVISIEITKNKSLFSVN